MTTNLTGTDLGAWARIPFSSDYEMVAAMQSERYRSHHDQAFRDAVAAKIAVSQNSGVSGASFNEASPVIVGDTSDPAASTEERAEDRRLFADLMIPTKPMAVRPEEGQAPSITVASHEGGGFRRVSVD